MRRRRRDAMPRTPRKKASEPKNPQAPSTGDAIPPMGPLTPDEVFERQVSGALMQLRMRSPFFSTLALFARIRRTRALPTAATDGRDIYVNADYFANLTAPERAGLLLHEV